jgi:hypothetical protein
LRYRLFTVHLQVYLSESVGSLGVCGVVHQECLYISSRDRKIEFYSFNHE